MKIAGVVLGMLALGGSASASSQTPDGKVAPVVTEAKAGGSEVASAARTDQVPNVATEAAPEEHKREGEHLFVVGLPLGWTGDGSSGTFGLSLGYLYEAERFGVGIEGLVSAHSGGFVGIAELHGLYYPLNGTISPYLGAGIGLMAVEQSPFVGTGGGASAEIGLEFLRQNRRVHLQLGIEGLFPFYKATSTVVFASEASEYYPVGTKYLPTLLLYARVSL